MTLVVFGTDVPIVKTDSGDTLAAVRRLLFALLWLGIVGTLVELLLIAHYEDVKQWIPLVLMALTLVVLGWQAAWPSRRATRVLQVAMALFVVTGAIGIALHYDGAKAFQVEVDPSLAGMHLFWKVMRAKAPPALAPGTMVGLGLIGLAYAQCTGRT